MKKLILYIENLPITVSEWVIGSIGILFIRIFLENLSSPPPSGFITSDLASISHLLLFFWCLTLSLILVIQFFSKESITKVSNLALFGLIITWLPPILDLIFSGGKGFQLFYVITTSLKALIVLFFLFFGPISGSGISLGIRLEILIALAIIFYYTLQKTNIKSRAGKATIVSYSIIYAWLSIPSIIMLMFGLFSPIDQFGSVNEFLTYKIKDSVIAKNLYNGSLTLSGIRANEIFSVTAVNQVMLIIIFILSIFWFYKYDREKLTATILNSRFLRIIHYYIFLFIGLLIGNSSFLLINWIYGISLILLFLVFYSAWMFAVGTNDIEDIDSDKISNSSRPMVKNKTSIQETKNLNVFFLVYSFLGAALLGEYILFFVLVYTSAYYIYSAKPLKFKRIPIVSNFLVGIATLSATLSGYFFNSSTTNIRSFPIKYSILILVGITLGAIAKDIKDIRGDGAYNIKTLPVLLEKHPLKYPLATVWVLLFFSLPFFIFKNQLMLIPIIPFAVTTLYIMKYRFKESYLFVLYYFFIIITFFIQIKYGI